MKAIIFGSIGTLVETSDIQRQSFNQAFKECDLIVTPTAPSAAFPLDQEQDDPIKMYLNDVFTVPASLAGLPGISIPFGKDKNNLPLGIQILGKHFDEQQILNGALSLERSYG